MKLTADLVEGAFQYINPATKERELDLRGYKIPRIENMGATLDQFDSIDFSDNELKELDNFPHLKRIKKLLLNNNRISRISNKLHESLPNLEWLILTNNYLQELGDIDSLSSFTKLECLCLLNNPIATKKHYRQYIIFKIPTVRILDFRKVKLREREEASKLFKGKKGKELEKEIAVKSAIVGEFIPGGDIGMQPPTKKTRTDAEIESIKKAISRAQTFEEIERLNQILKSGATLSDNPVGDGLTSEAGSADDGEPNRKHPETKAAA